ncbi:MAG: hypothetical protein JXQ29_17320 [Planctomycetes bacterium]|nr:hypothetical protein [Planctomycetota bacterium]
MSLLDPRQKTISLKVVYYGPGLGGKTTSLKQVHRVIDPEGKVKLVSLDTDEDRTLFFDFLPIELGLVGRFKIKIQGFTVPGQVKYNMTRRYVLTGADGIVFVADSDRSRVVENVESLINLGDNLRAHGLNVNNIPLVFQYNKQDLPNGVPPAELEEKLNFRKVPSYPTIATRGDGVFDSFIAVSKLMVSRVIKTYNLKEEQADEDRILREVETRLRTLGNAPWGAAAAVASPVPPETVAAAASPAAARAVATDHASRDAVDFFGSFTSAPPAGPAHSVAGGGARVLRDPELVHPVGGALGREAARPAAADAPQEQEALPELRQQARSLGLLHPGRGETAAPRAPAPPAADPGLPVERVTARPTSPAGGAVDGSWAARNLRHVLRSLAEIGRGLAAGSTLEKTATAVLSAACQALEATGGSLVVRDESGTRLRPLFLHGFRNDPLLVAQPDEGQQLLELLEGGGDHLLVSAGQNRELHAALCASSPDVEMAVVVPVVIRNRVQGALAIYLDEALDLTSRREALKVLTVLAYQAAVGLLLNGTR